ncbi:MAG: hypothetical protein HY851_11070, partial [candidate division Zixibacteria bacterium]|nr:hypothetical protein [candidate division Zixibacteria bacterium]
MKIAERNHASPETAALSAVQSSKRKSSGVIPRGLTFAAVAIILLMLAVILGNIVIHGAGT